MINMVEYLVIKIYFKAVNSPRIFRQIGERV